MDFSNNRILRIYEDTGLSASTNIIYQSGENALSNALVIGFKTYNYIGYYTFYFLASASVQTIPFYTDDGQIIFKCNNRSHSGNGIYIITDLYLTNCTQKDGESVRITAGHNRIELLNENGVLICDNGEPDPDGKYPDYSKDYWKNAPALVADEVQDDPDVFKLICTPANLQSDSIALYGAVGAGDPELIETKATAASISFNVPIADLDPGTYTFTAVPVKGTALGIASTGVELVIPEPEPDPENP